MSRPKPHRVASASRAINMPGSRLTGSRSYHQIFEVAESTLRMSLPIHNSPTIPSVAIPKFSRTSKTSQRHVVLPSEAQTRPLPDEVPEGVIPTYDIRSEGERMSKEERQKTGYSRMTAYSLAEGIRTKQLSAFLKREHAVLPRVFDEAIYVVRKLFNVCRLLTQFIRCTTSPYYLVMLQMLTYAPLYLFTEGLFSLVCQKQKNMGMRGHTSRRRKRLLGSHKTAIYPHLLLYKDCQIRVHSRSRRTRKIR